MHKHEQKTCPRCNELFECKVGDVSRCQCSGTQLNLEVQAFIVSKYSDCLLSAKVEEQIQFLCREIFSKVAAATF